MIRNIIFSSILLSFSVNALAFTCPNMRLDKNFPNGKPTNVVKYKTMEKIPVQKQELGICYAYSAAQMADAIRHKRQLEKGISPDNRVSSPVFLAVNTAKAWDEQGLYYKTTGNPHFPFEGGHFCDAFQTASKLGTCPKDKLDNFFDINKLDEATFFKKLLKVEEDLKKKHKDINKQFVKEVIEIKDEPLEFDGNIFDQIVDKNQALHDSVTNRKDELLACQYTAVDELYDSFKEVFGDAFKINRFLFKTFFTYDMFDNTSEISFIFRNICPAEDRLKVNTNATCKTYDVEKSIDSGKSYPFTQKIIEELKKDSLPVGISYCSKVLKRGSNYDGITSKSKSSLVFKKDKNGNNDCGNHASVIIGSRWNPQKKSCELLVRNSWGAQCTSYKKYYPSQKYFKERHPGVKPSQYDIKCEAGNIWVDYKQLEKNIYRVQHL